MEGMEGMEGIEGSDDSDGIDSLNWLGACVFTKSSKLLSFMFFCTAMRASTQFPTA